MIPILTVFAILVLGYARIKQDRGDFATFRRTAGWESYAYLAHSAVLQLISGLRFGIVWLIISYLLFVIISLFGCLFSPHALFNRLWQLFDLQSFPILLVLLSWLGILPSKQGKLSEKERAKIRNIDAISELAISAFERNMPLRVNLKSGKVYIGMIIEEQFERLDKDHLMLIPYMSGFRAKENGQMTLDCSYIELYRKQQIEQDVKNLLDFRMVIRLNEVETLSLFDFSLINQFTYQGKS